MLPWQAGALPHCWAPACCKPWRCRTVAGHRACPVLEALPITGALGISQTGACQRGRQEAPTGIGCWAGARTVALNTKKDHALASRS